MALIYTKTQTADHIWSPLCDTIGYQMCSSQLLNPADSEFPYRVNMKTFRPGTEQTTPFRYSVTLDRPYAKLVARGVVEIRGGARHKGEGGLFGGYLGHAPHVLS